ncbi:MFS general substrate transporter [Acephala macrosclerotiorum]|nr:MFS general substrate transporter [Acephala macrosclerotiorum]
MEPTTVPPIRHIGRFVPHSSAALVVLTVLSCLVNSMTMGYDGNMMNGLNILPSFYNTINLNTAGESANTGIIWVGGCAAGFFSGFILDRHGLGLGIGVGLSSVACPTYVSEVSQLKWRAFSLGFYYDFWYGGGIIASAITYGTAKIGSSWAWRIPSILQVVPKEALEVLAIMAADGDTNNPVVVTQFLQIKDTIAWERGNKPSINWADAFQTPQSRRRMILACSCAIFGNMSGSGIISYYLGTMLTQAGVTNTTTQLEINIYLPVWCLFTAILGTSLADRIGRKRLGAGTLSVSMVFLFLVGAFTKLYGDGSNTRGVYGTVACIFLYQGSYAFGWSTLLVMYPPEVLNYSLRANGMSIYTFVSNAAATVVTFAFPYALAKIGWKTCMINASWDALEIAFIVWYWVETSGKTLEEVDELIDGVRHSDAPVLMGVIRGDLEVDLKELRLWRVG